MVQPQSQGYGCAPGVTQHDGTVDAEDSEGISDQLSLGSRTPCRTVRTVAVAKTRTVERNHAMSLGYQVEHPASIEILGRDHVAVEQNDRGAFPPLDVMQADTIHGNELTSRRMLALRFPRAIDVVTVIAAIVAAADAKIPIVLDGFEIRLIDESFLSRPLSLSELLRVEVAALWQRVPRLHREVSPVPKLPAWYG